MKTLIATLLAFCTPAFAQTSLYTYTNGSGNGQSVTTLPGGQSQPFDLSVVFGVQWPIAQTMLPTPLTVSGQWNVTGGRSPSTNHTAVPVAPTLWFGQYQNVAVVGTDVNGACIYADQTPCQFDANGNLVLEGTQTAVVLIGSAPGDIVQYCQVNYLGATVAFPAGTEVDYVGCAADVHFGIAPAVNQVSQATDVNGNPISFVRMGAGFPYVWRAGTTDISGNFTLDVVLAPSLYIIDTAGITSCSGRGCQIKGGSNLDTSWRPAFTPPPPPICHDECMDRIRAAHGR